MVSKIKMRHCYYVTVLLPLLAVLSLCQQDQTVSPPSPERPVLSKCCGPGQTLEMPSLKCVSVPPPSSSPSPQLSFPETLEPPFLSQLLSQDEFYPDAPAFAMSVSGLPRCDPNREDISTLLNIDNDLALTNYAIDDLNKTGSPFGLYDFEESEKYESFCLETGHTGLSFRGTVAVFCRLRDEITCQTRPCVSFCCDKRMYFDSGLNRCMPDPHTTLTELPFVDEDGVEVEVPKSKIRYYWNQKELISGSCPEGRTGIWTDFSLLGKSGSVRDINSNVIDFSSYCMERIGHLLLNESTGLPLPDSNTGEFPLVAVVCTALTDDGDFVSNIVIPILLIISLIFLGLLFAYIYFKPDKLHPQARSRNQSVVAVSRTHAGRVSTTSQRVIRPPLSLFELMTLSLVAMLFIFYVFLILAKFAWWQLLTGFLPGCVTVGVAIQASFLSAHFWLNAMNFTVWRGLRQMRVSGSAGGGGGTTDRNRRYRWYATYAWGTPAAMVVITLIMQLTPGLDVSPEYLPGIGVNNCLLSQSYGVVFYQTILIVPLIALNILFFLLSAWNLVYGVWKDERKLANRNKHEARHKIVIKMFFAMGIPWIAEVISYVLDKQFGRENVKWYVLPFDIINALQGLVIFCVIFFDAKKLDALKALVRGNSSDDRNRRPSNLVTLHTNDGQHHVNSHRAKKVSVVTPPRQDQLDTINEDKV